MSGRADAGLPPNATIGIIGGGQLGRMSAMAAARLGYRCHILSPEPDSPAAQVSAASTIADYEDPEALRRFAGAVDVITFEFENVSAAGLDLLASLRPVRPSPGVLRISQDRVTEKSFLRDAGVPTAPWREVADRDGLQAAVDALRLPSVLKTTRGGYDGKGQAVLRDAGDVETAWAELGGRPLVLEGFVDYACEISVVVARGDDGGGSLFDAVENRHRDGILDLTLAPARVAPSTAAEAARVAWRVAENLGLVGVLAVEMFVDRRRPRAGERDRAAPAQLRPLDHRGVPGQPVRAAYPCRCRPAAAAGVAACRCCHEEPGRPRGDCAMAGDCRDARPDPAPLRQGRGQAGPQDGSCHPVVPARHAAGRRDGDGSARLRGAALSGRNLRWSGAGAIVRPTSNAPAGGKRKRIAWRRSR